jgi:NADPH:quinone reductase-like Zn-dependent oxidoreductase
VWIEPDVESVEFNGRADHTLLPVTCPVFGLTDWTRNGTLAEYVAVEARNLAPLSAGIDHVAAAALPMPGLTAWQGLFDHGHLASGQTVLIHGDAGGVVRRPCNWRWTREPG